MSESKQNDLKSVLTIKAMKLTDNKNEFALTNKKYRDALKYYGYDNSFNNKNLVIYPTPVLKNSKTLLKQSSLPRLPVPSLINSINKYLFALKHLLTEEEFQNTKKIAYEFCYNGLGEILQRLLIERSKTTENWLYQWWLDKIYLEPRYSIVINVNPGTLYPKADYKNLDEKLSFVAQYVIGFLEFKKYLEDQNMPPEKLGDSSLCMDQYFKLLGTCRIPNKEKDIIRILQIFNLNHQKNNHVIVMVNKRIFSMQIIDQQTGVSLSVYEIYKNLQNLVKCSRDHKGIGLGILTAENRDTWFNAYSILEKNEKNRKNFEKIHNSLFVICLDNDENSSSNSSNNDLRSLGAGQMLHGNKQFTSNRYFDKSIQVIFGDNGIWGINFEHSIAEAVPHAFMNDFIYSHLQSNQENFTILEYGQHTKAKKHKDRFEELKFQIPNEIEDQIIKSNDAINRVLNNLEMYVLNFEAFGKNFPKSQKISPDAFVQLAMQLAFYRAHNKLGNTYESGSLRKFHLGRTDIIRTCSYDAEQFVKSMPSDDSNNDSFSNADRATLFLKAINSHRVYTNNVINCESFDRHLLGLKLTAIENNYELPELYKDVAYERACHYHISSSQVSSKYDSVTCYGPATEDGYGACYNIMEKKIMFGLSSYNSCPSTSARMFANYIQNALIDCQNLLIKINHKL